MTTAQPRSAKSRPTRAPPRSRMLLADARRAEERDRGPVDLLDRREARAELLGDRQDFLRQRALGGREELLVVHHVEVARRRASCSIPNDEQRGKAEVEDGDDVRCHGSTR